MTDFVIEPQTQISLADFLALAEQDETPGKCLQLVSGEIIEVPSNAYAPSVSRSRLCSTHRGSTSQSS